MAIFGYDAQQPCKKKDEHGDTEFKNTAEK